MAEGTPYELKNRYVQDTISVYGVSDAQIKSLHYDYKKVRDGYQIKVDNTSEATKLIVEHQELFQDSVPELQKEDLIKADSLFKELSFQVPNSYVSYFWRARVNSMLDPETTKGLAKPYYEKVIEIGLVQPERYKRELIECYKYLGYYHYVIADAITTKNNGNPDLAKEEYGEAKSFFSKVLTLDAKDEVALKALESIKL